MHAGNRFLDRVPLVHLAEDVGGGAEDCEYHHRRHISRSRPGAPGSTIAVTFTVLRTTKCQGAQPPSPVDQFSRASYCLDARSRLWLRLHVGFGRL